MKIVKIDFDMNTISYWLKKNNKCNHVQSRFDAHAVWQEEVVSEGSKRSIVVCKSCFDELKESYNNEKFACCDCHQTFKRIELNEWWKFDINILGGDKAIFICSDCWRKEKHQSRLLRDRVSCMYKFNNAVA